MHEYDVVLVTESRFDRPDQIDWYIGQILEEDRLVREALESIGLRVHRCDWMDPNFDWGTTRSAVVRSTWDYIHRIDDFRMWLERTSEKTILLNPPGMILWNTDKHYLAELADQGINIPPTVFMEMGDARSLAKVCAQLNWREFVLKPTISGGGHHTYKFATNQLAEAEAVHSRLIKEQSMMIQEFQTLVPVKGEVAIMLFDGKCSHAVLKQAKAGEFRVQDDFGGTVHHYQASSSEIDFAESVIAAISPTPAYARVDFFWDNQNELCLSELELIEPELWFRFHPSSALHFAEAIALQIG